MPSKLGVSTADRRHALDPAAALGACSQREEVSGAFKELPGFVGAESVTFGEVQVPSRLDAPLIMRAECSDPSIYDAQMMEAISWLWRQQPVIVHQLRSPTPHPVKISDLSAATEWQRSELRNDSYRRVGLVHEMAAHFSWTPRSVSCAALHRSGSDFSERERALLGLMTPHLEAACDRVSLHERLSCPHSRAGRLAGRRWGRPGRAGCWSLCRGRSRRLAEFPPPGAPGVQSARGGRRPSRACGVHPAALGRGRFAFLRRLAGRAAAALGDRTGLPRAGDHARAGGLRAVSQPHLLLSASAPSLRASHLLAAGPGSSLMSGARLAGWHQAGTDVPR